MINKIKYNKGLGTHNIILGELLTIKQAIKIDGERLVKYITSTSSYWWFIVTDLILRDWTS